LHEWHLFDGVKGERCAAVFPRFLLQLLLQRGVTRYGVNQSWKENGEAPEGVEP